MLDICHEKGTCLSRLLDKLCPLCQATHCFSSCPTFVQKNSTQRRELAARHHRCFNCLSSKHSVKDCKSKFSCRTCQRKHHTMVYVDSSSNAKGISSEPCADTSNVTEAAGPSSPASTSQTEINSLLTSTKLRSHSQVLLATAQVTVSVEFGRSVTVRALLDQGSEMTFISENLAQLLCVKRLRMPVSISV